MDSTSSPATVAAALCAYDAVLAATPGYRARPGQRIMVSAIAETFASAQFASKDEGSNEGEPSTAVSVVQAGTGVGKSTGYTVPGVVIAKARGIKLLISTATVALQEQLVGRDLPALAQVLPGSFTFALAKGRSRYLCPLKLDTLLQDADQRGFEDFDASDAAEPTAPIDFYRSLDAALESGWDGDRDSLDNPPEPTAWSSVAADRYGCANRRCPRFANCPYFAARSTLAKADVIVANHDLVLASLGTTTLPELDKCLLVFDEGHHLPAKAIDQFSGQINLTRLRWLRRLPKVLAACRLMVQVESEHGTEQLADALRKALSQLQQVCQPLIQARQRERSYRFVRGALPQEVQQAVLQVEAAATTLCDEVRAVGNALRDALKSAKGDPKFAQAYTRLAQLTPSLDDILECTSLLRGDQKVAKWIELGKQAHSEELRLRACPINPGELLNRHLWQHSRAVAITSATLTTCGTFNFFLQESGLDLQDQVETVIAASPFDYAAQGSLRVIKTQHAPKALDAFNQEVAELLALEIGDVKLGALALFASRKAMDLAYEALPSCFKECVLVQGIQARGALLREHKARVHRGQRSVIFGLQSFGEGLDLPGDLCGKLFIAKLPFAPPTDPVGEARAEYLRDRGGNPFDELVVPAVGMKLLQWTGRAIRTETDCAEIVVFDERLASTRYGRTILQGLPPYPLKRESPPVAA
jgi:ATP-dependent DNA helicase DinG